MMIRRENTPVFLQSMVLVVMLLLTPYAMTFSPYEGIYTDKAWPATLHLDPLYPVRAGLIVGGLIGAVLSVALLIWELIRKSTQVLEMSMGSDLILQMSITICSLSIGWAAFPYWVNGVFQAYIGNAPLSSLSLFDPQYLMPTIWIGEIWSLGVLLIFVTALCAFPILFLFNLGFSIRNKTWKQGIATIACLAITAAIFLSPGYFRWFAD